MRAVVTVSESTRRDLVELGYPEERIHIVPNGLDWNTYHDCPSLARDKEDTVAYVGRITPYKRLEDILKAWRRMEQEHPQAKLVLAGRPDRKYLERLKRLRERLGLKQVEFKANIPQEEEKKLLLAKAKVMVYTSTREGWGQTVLEAAACKPPAVAYNVPGLRDSVKHMETGILVKPGDTRGLAEAVTLLLTDERLRRRLGENAYRHARRFSWDHTAEEFS